MPTLNYIKGRVDKGTLTVADCIDLFFDSIITHEPVQKVKQVPGLVWGKRDVKYTDYGEKPTSSKPDPHVPAGKSMKFAHAHAHIASDGFRVSLNPVEVNRLTALRKQQDQTKKDEPELSGLAARSAKPRFKPDGGLSHKPLSYVETQRLAALRQQALTAKDQAELSGLEARALMTKRLDEREGLHLDPATRGALDPVTKKPIFDPERKVVDEQPYSKLDKKGALKAVINPPAYYQRGSGLAKPKTHSQFEDSEVASMALYYALLSPGGKEALNQLSAGVEERVSLDSKSAANAINNVHTIKHGGNSPPTYHPNYAQVAMVVDRQQGNAGTGGPLLGYHSVLVALRKDAKNDLHLVTMFPCGPPAPPAAGKAAPPAPQDEIDYGGKTTTKVPQAAAAAPKLRWGDDAPLPGQCKNADLKCCECKRYHPVKRLDEGVASYLTLGSYSNYYWHECKSCNKYYCGSCARSKLGKAAQLSTCRDRICGCGGRTRLVDE